MKGKQTQPWLHNPTSETVRCPSCGRQRTTPYPSVCQDCYTPAAAYGHGMPMVRGAWKGVA